MDVIYNLNYLRWMIKMSKISALNISKRKIKIIFFHLLSSISFFKFLIFSNSNSKYSKKHWTVSSTSFSSSPSDKFVRHVKTKRSWMESYDHEYFTRLFSYLYYIGYICYAKRNHTERKRERERKATETRHTNLLVSDNDRSKTNREGVTWNTLVTLPREINPT